MVGLSTVKFTHRCWFRNYGWIYLEQEQKEMVGYTMWHRLWYYLLHQTAVEQAEEIYIDFDGEEEFEDMA